MAANSSINVGQDVSGVASPQSPIRPVAVQTIGGIDYPGCILFDSAGNILSSWPVTISPTGLTVTSVVQGKKLFSDFPALPTTVTILDSSLGTILACSAQNTLNQNIELSFDNGTNWVELNAKQNFSLEFADKFTKISQGIIGRRTGVSPGVAPTVGNIIIWGTVV